MRRPRLGPLLGVGLPAVVVVLFFGAWAFDTTAAADGTLRNVELDGESLGSTDEAGLWTAVAEAADDFAAREVRIDTGEQILESTAGELGLTLDQRPTVAALLDEGRTGNDLLRPFQWAASFLSPLEVRSSYALRADQLSLKLAGLQGEAFRQPVEPEVVAAPEGVTVQPGVVGSALDPDEVGDALMAAARAGEDPIVIEVEPIEQAPEVSDVAAQEVANEANRITEQPFVVTVAGNQATFQPDELRTWLSPMRDGNEFALNFDGEAIRAALVERIGSLGDTEPQDARFDVVNGAVQIIPAVTGLACCADDAPSLIANALRSNQHTIELEAVTQEPDLTTEEAEALGIREPVGTTTEWKGQAQVKSFTTYFEAGQPRVTNIQLIADAVRGTVVLPGETFSMNAVAGERTAAKGYLSAGAIRDGRMVEEIGGGVSQFATTMFNAAFFAGLPFVTYQAHSQYFDRYPRGREATMGYPAPDLEWRNDTPHGILVWTSYTATSVTVTLYSTQYAYGQQTGQSESPSGAACTTVTTQRTITYADGRTAQDSVRATYRDSGARTCNG